MKNCKFLFSVVMAVYNVEDYIDEAINSLLNQSLSFEDNVQLILVNDGSTDNSYNICKSYQEKYPDNIILLSKKNGGAGSARNLGLKYVEGNYVNFLDSDDILSENALKEVLNFFKKHEEVDFVAIPLCWFGATDKEHPLNYKFDGVDRVVNLINNPEFIHLHPATSFFKKESVINYKFLENTVRSEDSFLVNQILINNPQYGIINKPKYYYRKRSSKLSLTDTARFKKEYYIDYLDDYCFKLINYSVNIYSELPKFIQYLLIYEIKPIVYSEHIKSILNKSEYEEFIEKMRELLNFIDDDIILNHLSINQYVKSFLIYLKNDDFHIVARPQKNKVFLKSNDYIINKLHNHQLHLDSVELENDYLNISGLFASNCQNEFIGVYATKINSSFENEVIESFNFNSIYENRNNQSLLGVMWKFFYNFNLNIPISQLDDCCQIKLFINYSEDETVIFYPKIKLRDYCDLSNYSNYSIQENRIISFENNLFYVFKNSLKIRLRLILFSFFKNLV